MRLKRALCIFSTLLLAACANENKVTRSTQTETSEEKNAAETFEVGKLIPQIPLKANATQSFALYLPRTYSDTGTYPVIIFFDPHAEGTLPLNKYRGLADKYGYILAASNNSKNGMSTDAALAVGNNLISELINRLPVNQSKIALCGFSGGAKVALFTGAHNPLASAVIYCGAATEIDPNHPIALLGFAGTRDMNYTDVVAFDWSLATIPVRHRVIEWSGKHEFPSATVFEDAFKFLITGDLEPDKRKEISITPELVKAEQAHKQRYIEALQNPNLAWWKSEINSLNKRKHSNVMDERLLDYISLACYSITVNALQQKDLVFAEKILNIYKLADPTNKACAELKAELEKKKKGS